MFDVNDEKPKHQCRLTQGHQNLAQHILTPHISHSIFMQTSATMRRYLDCLSPAIVSPFLPHKNKGKNLFTQLIIMLTLG